MTRYTMKKPEKRVLIFLIILCAALLFFILYVQGEINGLQRFLQKKAESGKAKIEKTEEIEQMPYTLSLRVAITGADASVYWSDVAVAGEDGLVVDVNGQQTTITAGETYVYPGEGNVRLSPAGQGQLHIAGRDNGYEGVLEICKTTGGIMIINEIQMESYLKRVVPSEMPRTYGAEALKAQAVCARTYAYANSNTYAYPEARAHMDDTVSFQVYNNGSETAETNEAIAATAGEVLLKGSDVLPTMYYSTSCGYLQDGTMFGGTCDLDVYASEYSGIEAPVDQFETYIRKGDPYAYESQERYFRWQGNISAGDMEALRTALRSLLKDEDALSCNKKMQRLMTSTKKSAEKALGALEEIKITQRNPGGAAMAMELSFAGGKVLVNGELHIRQVLGSMVSGLTLQNGEVLSQVSTLPSAAIVVDKQSDNNFVVYGGGFGHGVGMSQNGAKALCAMGYTYKDILQYYYKNTQLSKIE